MFEFYTNKGVAIDGQNLNVSCVRQVILNGAVSANPAISRSFYESQTPVLIFDFELTDVKVPVIGISLYTGIGYAQCSYIKDGRKRVRIWLTFNEALIKKSFTNFKPPNSKDVALVNYCTSFFKLTAYIYDINPTPSRQNYGLKVYNDKGELVFDSNYRPMKIGIKGDINNGKHIIFINRFLAFEWLISDQIWLRDILSSKCNPFMVTFYQGICEYAQAFERAGLKNDFYMPSAIKHFYDEFIEYEVLRPMIGYY